MRLRLPSLAFSLLLLGGALRSEPAPLPVGMSAQERAIVLAYRAWLEEVAQAEARFQGVIETTDGPLSDLGKVDFILQQTADWPRRYLHEQDHNLIFSAVKGQSAAELEANLPAIIYYIRLAVASRTYHSRARLQHPLVGERRGLVRVVSIAKQVYDFRNAQIERVKQGAVTPARVLTRQNLGALADPKLLSELRSAYLDGQTQFTNQRNAVVLALFAVEIGISFLIAFLFLRRRPTLVTVRTAI